MRTAIALACVVALLTGALAFAAALVVIVVVMVVTRPSSKREPGPDRK